MRLYKEIANGNGKRKQQGNRAVCLQLVLFKYEIKIAKRLFRYMWPIGEHVHP